MVAYLSVVCPECGMRHELKITETTARRIVADMDKSKEPEDFGALLRGFTDGFRGRKP